MKTLTGYLILAGFVAIPCSWSARVAAETRPDLSGRVTRSDGTPLPKATVFIYTAGPKKGTASTCPSCYPDCRKNAQTDAQGRFTIEALDPTLRFRVLIVASGHQPEFLTKVDPGAGPVDAVLKPLDLILLKSKSNITGMVLDPAGKPLVGVVIGPEGVERGTTTQWGGTDDFVDPVGVSDDHGRFSLRCQENVNAVLALADGRGVAKRWVTLRPGRDHLIRMQEGVTVTGRIVRNGQPFKNAAVGLVTTDRTCGKYLHDFEASSDANGFFALLNVAPDNDYYLFTKMDSLQDQGALPVKAIKSGTNGSVLQLGDLALTAGYRLAGKVSLTDGQPVPPDTRLFLGRERAWDHTETPLDPDGRFEFRGIPDESVSLTVKIKGYTFSTRDPNFDWANGGIAGRVNKNIDNLAVLMDPGEPRSYGDEEIPPGADRHPAKKPFRSAKP
ncbi:MAG TPA: carboxypeptidase-like regulatory domain-containing protein [Verrucomicrobiae bacterium]|nr:carboxypeptidase-like regulatory domain-containing protein [Verrucomicrobiae bacterium]